MSTYYELQQEARRRIGNVGADALLNLKDSINNIIQDITKRHNWSWLLQKRTITTTASIATYTLWWDFDRPEFFWNSSYKLVPQLAYDIYREYPNPTSTGTPQYYYFHKHTNSAYYSAGTINLSATSWTGINSTATSDWVGRSIVKTGESVEYVVSSVTDGQHGVINRTYGGTIAATTYKVDPAPIPIIGLYPIPNASGSLNYYYYRRLPKLINNNDVPELPLNLHYLIQIGAYYEFLKYENKYDAGFVNARDEYERYLKIAIQADEDFKKGDVFQMMLNNQDAVYGRDKKRDYETDLYIRYT